MPCKHLSINHPLIYGKPQNQPFSHNQNKKYDMLSFPALPGYCNFCQTRRPRLQPSHGARSVLKSEGCRHEVEVCHEGYSGSSDL